MKKTLTLGYRDNPTITILRGHVTATVFNKAYAAEGWRGGGWVHRSNLRHEFWKRLKRSWKKTVEGKPGAIAVTVMDW